MIQPSHKVNGHVIDAGGVHCMYSQRPCSKWQPFLSAMTHDYCKTHVTGWWRAGIFQRWRTCILLGWGTDILQRWGAGRLQRWGAGIFQRRRTDILLGWGAGILLGWRADMFQRWGACTDSWRRAGLDSWRRTGLDNSDRRWTEDGLALLHIFRMLTQYSETPHCPGNTCTLLSALDSSSDLSRCPAPACKCSHILKQCRRCMLCA